MVGGEGWAFELTSPEWKEFVDLHSTLEAQHSALKDKLMAEEAIELELDRGVWWGCLAGDCHSWSLAIVLTPEEGRGVEWFLPAPTAAALVAAVRTLG